MARTSCGSALARDCGSHTETPAPNQHSAAERHPRLPNSRLELGEGTAKGLPGVARWTAEVFAGLAPALLYNNRGEVVGSENAQFFTNGAAALACNTPEGFRSAKFSSVIELTG
jgi:hypothetical protein